MFKPVVTLLLLLGLTPCLADVRLPKVLSSHMVLQQNSTVKIWGWADAGEAIDVSANWLDSKTSTTADADGRW